MLRAGVVLTLAFLALFAGGCGQVAAPPPADASQTATEDPVEWSEQQSICLADPAGSTPLDREIRDLQRQAKALPAKADAWILVGRAWVRKARLASDPGFFVNVRSCADETLRLQPGNSAALGLSALALMNDHQFREAGAAADQILRKDSGDLIALGIRSDALLELGAFEQSAETTEQMLDLRPDMASYSRASYIRWLQGDTRNAKSLIRQALEGRDARDPESAAWTFVQAGLLYWNEGDYEGADAIFTEALRWVADYPAALVGQGRAALGLKQPKRAIECLSRAYKVHPLPETAWLLGDARAMSGDAAGAEADYARAVRDGRRSDRLTLASFYACKNRNPEEALQLIQEERKVRGNIYVDDTCAWTLYRLGRLDEAKAAIDHAMRLGTPDARLLFHAGAIRLALGDPKGRRLIEEALRINPNFDWTAVAEAKRLLAVSHARNS